MRLLMTGGYGCIGSWVARRLVEAGRELWIYDLQEDTHRLDLLVDPDRRALVHYEPGDVADPAALLATVDKVGATHILHLAGLQVPSCRADPIRGATVNVLGTLAVFEAAAARRDQVARVAYASSAAVHGPPDPAAPGPVPDEVRLSPTSHYGAFKVCNELNARVYWLDRGVSSVGLRPWTVYGVGRDFGVTSEPTRALLAAAAGRPFAITYGGLQDFQYADDVAAAFLAALESPFEGADAFNVRGAVAPLGAFVAALESAFPEAAGLVTYGDRQLPIAPDLDDHRLRAALGPMPITPLAAGVADTYRRFRDLLVAGRIEATEGG